MSCPICDGKCIHLVEVKTVPTESIVIGDFGEQMRDYPGESNVDDREMTTCVGVHNVCRGWIDIREISTTHRALVCRSCSLRCVIPSTVRTYGDLRLWSKYEKE